jgi:hypothetical protein
MGGATLLLLWQTGDGEDGAVEVDTVINYYALRGIEGYRASLTGLEGHRAELRGIQGYRRELKESP